MEVIYPTNRAKYTGSITTTTKGRIRAVIKTTGYSKTKTCETREEAEDWIMMTNVANNLPISNLVHDMGTHCEMELTQGQRMLFSKVDIDRLDQHTWTAQWSSCSNAYYVVTKFEGKSMCAHNLILNHIPTNLTVDHRDGNPLNNQRANLRVVDKQAQMINRKIFSNNKSGVTGVTRSNTADKWLATWADEHKMPHIKSFSINKYGEETAKRMAVEYRRQKEAELPHYQYLRAN